VQVNPVVKLIFLVLAIICAAIFTFCAFDWFTYEHPFGFLGLAVTFGLASRLP
jgi:hypothetical protein